MIQKNDIVGITLKIIFYLITLMANQNPPYLKSLSN